MRYNFFMVTTPEISPKEKAPVQERMARTAFIERLLAEGHIPAIPEGRPGPPPRAVPVQGRPISETLIEDRR